MRYEYMRTVHTFEGEAETVEVESPAPNFFPVSERYFPMEALSEFSSLVHGRTIRHPRLEILWRRSGDR